MLLRFHDVERAGTRKRWRGVIANGQFMLFRRDAYRELGGHETVRGEVVEDLAFAQLVVRRGLSLGVRMAESSFATRMYRSLGQLVSGWSKNILLGGLQTMPPLLRPMVAPASAVVGAFLWLVPPGALVGSLLGYGSGVLLAWSGMTVAVSAVLWALFTSRMGAPAWYGLLYPLGAGVGMYIFLRAWIRGRRVEWKGRAYVVRDPAEVR
jgi:chlorobactene glucosyltransferase